MAEKWETHSAPANSTNPTSGWLSTPIARLCRAGSSQRERTRGDAARRATVMGVPSVSSGAASIISSRCWIMWSLKRVLS